MILACWCKFLGLTLLQTYPLKQLAVFIIVGAQLWSQPGDRFRENDLEIGHRFSLSQKLGVRNRAWLDVAKELVPMVARNMSQGREHTLCVPVPNQLPHVFVVVIWVGDVAWVGIRVLVQDKTTKQLDILVVNETGFLPWVAFARFVEQKCPEKLLHQSLGCHDLFLQGTIPPRSQTSLGLLEIKKLEDGV